MPRVLTKSTVPVRVHTLGLRLSHELQGAVEEQASKLGSYAKLVENCELHVGQWHLHHDAGQQYRVSLEIELRDGRGELVTSRQSELNAAPEALLEALRETFEASLVRLQHTA